MATPKNGTEILAQFHTYTGDQSDLSTADEFILLNKVYADILQEKPWEFLKKSASGSISSSNGVATIPFPDDYRFLIENNQKTDNTETIYNNAASKVIFVGPNYTPYQVINWSDRRQYRTSGGYVYPDVANERFVFTVAPTDTTYEFDYIADWDDIEADTYPLFPADFHDMIAQGMAVDSVIINLFDRAHSYARENQIAYNNALKKLAYWNSMHTYN